MNSLANKLASQLARFSPSFGKRIDDPLTNLKVAARWVESLPIGDAFKCQQAILGELKRFNENSTQYTKDRLAVLMLLDEKSRDLQDTLVRQYLRNPRMSRPVESQLWHAVYGLYWEIARGYHAFVLHFAREAGRSPHESRIPLIALRAILAFGQLLKWRTIRYQPAGEKLWLRLHNLYRVTETEGFHRQPLRAYAEDASDCSCETAYLHILMLNLADSGTLYPRQLDLLDHWLCGWHGMMRLDNRLDTHVHNFVIDLSSDQGPRRVRKPDTDKPLRFWSTADLLRRLQEIHLALREGRAPAQLGLTENTRTGESLELLDHLQRQWSSLAAREQRRAPRESIKRLVDVAHGLGAIVNQVKASEAPASVSPYGTGFSYSEADDVQVYGFITDRTRERISHIQPPRQPERARRRTLGDAGRKQVRLWRHGRIPRQGLAARRRIDRHQIARRRHMAAGHRAPPGTPQRRHQFGRHRNPGRNARAGHVERHRTRRLHGERTRQQRRQPAVFQPVADKQRRRRQRDYRSRPFHARQGSADPWRAGTQARCAGQPDRAQRRLDARCRRAGKRLIP